MSHLPYTPRFTPASAAAPDLTAYGKQMRRWTFLMIGGTVLLAGAFIGVQVYLLKSSKPHNESDKPPAWSSQVSGTFGKPFTAQEQPTADASSPKTEMEVLHGVIGNLEGAHLYQTYLNIGLLADARGKEIYTLQQAKELLETLNAFIDNADQQLALVPPSTFATDLDRKEMEEARSVTTLLRMETRALKLYWETGESVYEENYQQARDKAWAKIKAITHVQD